MTDANLSLDDWITSAYGEVIAYVQVNREFWIKVVTADGLRYYRAGLKAIHEGAATEITNGEFEEKLAFTRVGRDAHERS
jgi:hypothetical protein